jgi:hypothetical protein
MLLGMGLPLAFRHSFWYRYWYQLEHQREHPMPTKGTRQPWQIRFSYPPSERIPDGIKGTKSFTDPETACLFGRNIIRRGGTALMINRDRGQELTILINGSVPRTYHSDRLGRVTIPED